MKKQLALFSVILAGLVAVSGTALAQDGKVEKKAQAAEADAPAKKHGVLPMHGKVAAVDAAAGTITIGQMTINITSETKIHKDGKPATIADITVGEKVAGAYKKDESGKLNATVIRIVGQPEDGPVKKKKAEIKEKKAEAKDKAE
jgi:hypothetical protein